MKSFKPAEKNTKSKMSISHWWQIVFVASILSFLVFGCLYGSPDSDEPVAGQTVLVTPESEVKFASEDGVVIVSIPAGAVDKATKFKITTISKNSYPDLDLLQGDIYSIEPTLKLNKPITITFKLDAITGNGYTLSDLYTLDALALREFIPGKTPNYIKTLETIKDDKRVLEYTTDMPGTFAAFVSECYFVCEQSVKCPGYPSNAEDSERLVLSKCLSGFGCPNDLNKMNGDWIKSIYTCVNEDRACADYYNCCLEIPACQASVDGDDDIDIDIDQDLETDTEEQATDGDFEEAEEIELEQEVDPFLSETCLSPDDCTDMSCVFNASVNIAWGYCLALPQNDIEMYSYAEGSGWVHMTEALPMFDCVGNEPEYGTQGQDNFDIKVKISNWWSITSKAGIKVEFYDENNLNTELFTAGETDANGEINLQNVVLTEQWFVVKTYRESENAQLKIVPTYNWGYYITRSEAKAAGLNSQPIEIMINPIDKNRYDGFAKALGVVDGMPAGYGMILGQVSDCRNAPAYTIEKAIVGFKEATPLHIGYFGSETDFPIPEPARKFTNVNGLFAGIYLPSQNKLTAFAYGQYNTSGTTVLLGLSADGHLKLLENSVSIIRFNRLH